MTLDDLYKAAKKKVKGGIDYFKQPERVARDVFLNTTPIGGLNRVFNDQRTPIGKFFKPTEQVRVRDFVREIPGATWEGAKMIPQQAVRFGMSAIEVPKRNFSIPAVGIKPLQGNGGFSNTPFGRLNSFQSEAHNRVMRGDSMLKSIGNPALDTLMGAGDILGAVKPLLSAGKNLKHFGNISKELADLSGDLSVPLGLNRKMRIPARFENVNPNINYKKTGLISPGGIDQITAMPRETGKFKIPAQDIDVPFKWNSNTMKSLSRPGATIKETANKSNVLKKIYTESIKGQDKVYGDANLLDETGKLNQKLVEGRLNDVAQKMTANKIDPSKYLDKFKDKSFNSYKSFDIFNKKVINGLSGGKRNKFIQTVKDSQNTSAEVRRGIDNVYDPITNKATMAAADNVIAGDFEGAVNLAKTEQNLTTEIQAQSIRLVEELQAKGRFEDAIDIIEAASERATRGGQATQILAFYNRLTPEGVLAFAQREVNRAKKMSPGKYDNLKITPEQAKGIRKMAKDIEGLTGEAKQDATRKMLEEIARLVPTPWARKATTLWKAGLLTGIKGAIGGNAIGNSTMRVLQKLSDVPAAGIDNALALATGNRSKVFTLKGLISGFGKGIKIGASNMKKGIGAEDLVNKLDYNKVYFSKSLLGKAAQKYTDTVFNFYSAADRPFFQSALKNNLYDFATVQAKNKGLKGQAAKTFIKNLVESPNDELLVQATEAAENSVFRSRNSIGAGLSGFKQGLKKYGGSTGEIVSEGLLPFTGVPSAIATAVHNYSPTGAAVGVFKALKAASNKNFNISTQRELSESLAKGLTGTGAIWLGAQLAKSGQITLGYPKDPGERTLWEAEGKTPYSIKVGGKWRSLNYTGPIMSLLSIGGQIATAEGETMIKKVSSGLAGSGSAILSSSPLQGMQAGMNAVTDPQRYGDSYLKNQASSIVPTFVKDVAVAGDPLQREAETMKEGIQSKIPIARNKLLPKRDFFGEELQRQTGPIASIIDPFKSSKIKSNPTVDELRRLQDAGNGPTLSKLSKDQTVFGEKIKLTPSELNELEKSTGPEMKRMLEETINSEEYQKLPDEDKKDIIDKIVNGVRREVKESSVINKNSAFNLSDMSAKNKREMQKKELLDSDKSSMKVEGGWLRKNYDGSSAIFVSDSKYNSSINTTKLTTAKRNGNVREWFKTAESQFEELNKQLEDENADELDKQGVQNKIDALVVQYMKYKEYGGFTKPKKGKSSKIKKSDLKIDMSAFSESAPSTPKLSSIKVNLSSIKNIPKTIKLTNKKMKIPKINIKRNISTIPGAKRLV